VTKSSGFTSSGSLPVLPQLVPSQVCFRCEVCCRFPEPDSFLRPYFTENEITAALAAGVAASHFSDSRGCRVQVVPDPQGEGYLCPAFDPETSQCTIYTSRPLDCQIYPMALMWNPAQTEVLLGWDRKCPFLEPSNSSLATSHASLAAIEAYAGQVAARIEEPETLDLLAGHPRLIGPFQDDVVILRTLGRLTERLTETAPSRVTRRASPGRGLDLKPFGLEDRESFDRACSAVDTPLGGYAFAWHFIWRDLFNYSCAVIDGYFCLFAEYTDGIFMPLPPLPPRTRHASRVTRHALLEVVAVCFAFMRQHNRGSAVSRIENVSEVQKTFLEAAGYRLVQKDPDYLYRAGDLAALAGDRYKSQRAAVNRFHRLQRHRLEPYHGKHREACLGLYEEWVKQKMSPGLDAVAHCMLRDAAFGHRQALGFAADLGLRGSVAWVDDRIRGYTLGYARSVDVFCVLLEVADRAVPGLSQFLFQATCRDAVSRGIEYINTLDDSGLPELAKAKQLYRPFRLVPSYVVTERG
jgi:Fe-S-cluster containining protein